VQLVIASFPPHCSLRRLRQLHFHFAHGSWNTQILACMLDSLVRVSRRVDKSGTSQHRDAHRRKTRDNCNYETRAWHDNVNPTHRVTLAAEPSRGTKVRSLCRSPPPSVHHNVTQSYNGSAASHTTHLLCNHLLVLTEWMLANRARRIVGMRE
jgi:hypothetical protein